MDGRSGVARDGRSGVARDGRSGVARDGRSGVARDGRSGVARDGRSGVARDGRNGTVQDGRSGAARDGRNGLAQVVPRPTSGEPDWLRDARRHALDWVADHGLPTRKDEDWKYTRLRPMETVPFEPAAPCPHLPENRVIDALTGGSTCRLVFVNGHLSSDLSQMGELPAGVTVTNMASVLAGDDDVLQPLLGGPDHDQIHAFSALNTALTEDGAFIRLARGAVVEQPIELVFYVSPTESPMVTSPRSVVLAEAESRATIVATYAGTDGGVTCTNEMTEVVLGPDARLEVVRIQRDPDHAFHFGLLDVTQREGSDLQLHSVSLGGSTSRFEVRVGLRGEGASAALHGLYLCRGEQQHDNPVLVEHVAPNCTSRQLYKGVVDDQGHGVFNGHIVVHHGAFGTDASQTNKNLLLSDHAEVDTRPRLEILADDVKCSHGAAVGRLDESALFYLRSRGIPENVARGILTVAFADETVGGVTSDPVRARVEQLVADRLSSTVGSTAGVGGSVR
jgi:Fe-S cluster assembly protein SufD